MRPRTSKRRQATPGSSPAGAPAHERENLQYFPAIRVNPPATGSAQPAICATSSTLSGGRGQFQGERQPVEAATNRRHYLRIVLRPVHPGSRERRSVDKKPDRRTLATEAVIAVGNVRVRQGSDRVRRLALDSKRFAAGRHHNQHVGAFKQLASQRCGGIDEVFTVVQNQQGLLDRETIHQPVEDLLSARSETPSVAATEAPITIGSSTVARSTNQTPSG